MSTTCGKDGTVSTFESSRQTAQGYEQRMKAVSPPGMKPNPAFRPTLSGSKLYFADARGGLHKHASEAANENISGEQNASFTPTGGNCPQNPDLVPDFVPDK